MHFKATNIFHIGAAMLLLPLLWSCQSGDEPEPKGEPTVPEGMVEIRPALPGMSGYIPRDASDAAKAASSRAYDSNSVTNSKLGKEHRLPNGSTVWLIATTPGDDGKTTFVKKSYVVYNPEGNESMSYLVPCSVDSDGNMIAMDGAPLYLKDKTTYKFYAVSPARSIDEEALSDGKVQFQLKNGEHFYANDGRYSKTTAQEVPISSDNPEAVQVVKLSPMINQTAQLKFQIIKNKESGVHDLDIQPAGIQISGLQNDSPEEESIYGNKNGIYWHMSQGENDEPIILQHGGKWGTFNCYDYTIDSDKRINLEVPVLPMRSISKPIIVVFRLKINGVPTSYEMMLNEKDLKAGYSYGYRGIVSISDNVAVVTWQYVSWEIEVPLPQSGTSASEY